MTITKDELNRCKRATVVLAEIAKVSMKTLGQKAPLEMREDMLVLTKVLRRLETIAE
jgi:hypothetical protein